MNETKIIATAENKKTGLTIPEQCGYCGQTFTAQVHVEHVDRNTVPGHIIVVCHIDDNVDAEAHVLEHETNK